MLKLLVDESNEKLLGVHIVGEQASELIHIGQLVMNLQGNVRDLVKNVFNYPTLAECYKLAALDCVHQLEKDIPELNDRKKACFMRVSQKEICA